MGSMQSLRRSGTGPTKSTAVDFESKFQAEAARKQEKTQKRDLGKTKYIVSSLRRPSLRGVPNWDPLAESRGAMLARHGYPGD